MRKETPNMTRRSFATALAVLPMAAPAIAAEPSALDAAIAVYEAAHADCLAAYKAHDEAENKYFAKRRAMASKLDDFGPVLADILAKKSEPGIRVALAGNGIRGAESDRIVQLALDCKAFENDESAKAEVNTAEKIMHEKEDMEDDAKCAVVNAPCYNLTDHLRKLKYLLALDIATAGEPAHYEDYGSTAIAVGVVLEAMQSQIVSLRLSA